MIVTRGLGSPRALLVTAGLGLSTFRVVWREIYKVVLYLQKQVSFMLER
jgi:hypothetical protein